MWKFSTFIHKSIKVFSEEVYTHSKICLLVSAVSETGDLLSDEL